MWRRRRKAACKNEIILLYSSATESFGWEYSVWFLAFALFLYYARLLHWRQRRTLFSLLIFPKNCHLAVWARAGFLRLLFSRPLQIARKPPHCACALLWVAAKESYWDVTRPGDICLMRPPRRSQCAVHARAQPAPDGAFLLFARAIKLARTR